MLNTSKISSRGLTYARISLLSDSQTHHHLMVVVELVVYFFHVLYTFMYDVCAHNKERASERQARTHT